MIIRINWWQVCRKGLRNILAVEAGNVVPAAGKYMLDVIVFMINGD